MTSTSLAHRISPYVGGGVYAGLLDGPTSIPPDASVEVFNFAGLPEPIIPLAMMLLIEYLWAVIERRNQPALFVVDEGWSLLKNPASARFVEECIRRGRHHGIATLNMSQQVEDYLQQYDRGGAQAETPERKELCRRDLCPPGCPHAESAGTAGCCYNRTRARRPPGPNVGGG